MPEGKPWPRVSIVTPSYNQGRFIEETIRSVLLQGYPDMEYIIMDGGSTDESTRIIKKYEEWLSFGVSEPDNGQSDAINRGFSRSTGEIMAWLNSDDFYTPNAITRAARYFIGHPQAEILYGEAWFTDESGHRLKPCRHVRETIPKWYMLNVNPIIQPATLWRRSLWLTIGQLDSSLIWGLDWEFFIRAHLRTELHYIPEFLASCRLHDDMKSYAGGPPRHAELAKIAQRYGGWWQPTNIVYQAARPYYFIRRLTLKWPEPFRKTLVSVFYAPLFVLTRLFSGKYMS
jgi:glycosyltransferase involved in cell wall biosynthesis